MARTVQQIQSQLVANLVTQAATIGITITPTQWSRRNLLNLICYIVAVAISVFEQNYDQFKADTEATANALPPQTPNWIQAQSFLFQYSAADPQIVQLSTTTLTPYYPLVNTDYQIIKFCSVNIGGLGSIVAKVAKGTTPTPLTSGSTGELAAYQSYLNQIKTPGITIVAQSLDADEIYIVAQVYYVAQYSDIIQTNVIDAITAYLAGISFDGQVLVTDIIRAIRAVAGVNDVVLNTVRARENTISYPAGTSLINANLEITPSYQTVAGYIIPETTSGATLTDTLTFIPQ